MTTTRLTVFALASLCALPAMADAGGPFKTLSFDEAQNLAKKEHKLLFVDFYTTWCPPCELMEKTTFTDKWVTQWLADKAVALRIDADIEVSLAEKHQVEFYPTLVFLKPDGSGLDRLVGYVSAEQFKVVATDLERGITTIARGHREVKARPADPAAHLQLARALTNHGQYEGAYKEYIWCLDKGTDKHPEFAETRDSELLMDLAMLGDSYAPARQEMLARRDAAERRISAGQGTTPQIALYATVNDYMGESNRTLETYDRFAAQAGSSESVKLFAPYIFDALLRAKRHTDIAKTTDIISKVEGILRSASAAGSSSVEGQPNRISQMERQNAVAGIARYYQVLLALERVEDAREVAAKALALDNSADSYNALAWSAYLSEKPQPENLEQARRAHALAGDDNVLVLDTLVRVMHLLGKTREAIDLCEQALRKATTEQDKSILEDCLSDFRGSGD